MKPRTRDATDLGLLLEVAFTLALIALALFYYWRPAAQDDLSPRWWQLVLMGVLFFAIAALHTVRVRQRRHRNLHREIREEAAKTAER